MGISKSFCTLIIPANYLLAIPANFPLVIPANFLLVIPAQAGIQLHFFAIPAKAGPRRQDATASIRTANGPMSKAQKRRAIELHPSPASRRSNQ